MARSLAIFQLGESGGGTIIEQARCSSLPQIDEHYAIATDLFVKEENRHADVLALCVEKLGGDLISENWTARLSPQSGLKQMAARVVCHDLAFNNACGCDSRDH